MTIGMDNSEAIKRIKDHIRVHHIGEYPHIKIGEALNLAISALANDNNVGHKVEVVYCKECRFKTEPGQPNILCYNMKDDDFCSYGERKDNESH